MAQHDKELRKERAEAAEEEKNLSLAKEVIFRQLLGSGEGRIFLNWLLAETGLYALKPLDNQLLMAAVEGRRSIGVLLHHEMLNLDPVAYTQLLAEKERTSDREPDPNSRADYFGGGKRPDLDDSGLKW